MNINNFLLLLDILVAVFVVFGSFLYFLKVKTKYRWVKLFWALEVFVYLVILLWTFFGGRPNITIQYLAILLLLSSLLYGLVVSYSRLKEATFLQRMEEELNGKFVEWMEQQRQQYLEKKK